MLGCTKNEFMASLINPAIRDFTKEQAVDFLKKRYADKTDAYLKAVEKAYPNTTKPSDYIDIDLAAFRPGMVKHANLKADFGGAPVYAYLFTWQSPVNDGMYKAIHCIELGFVFNNIDRCHEMTGGGKEAKILEDKMSQAWINFARTGNPAHKGLPSWPAYTSQNGATMFFDNKVEVRNHHDKELIEISSGK